jgi:hypothetical protein
MAVGCKDMCRAGFVIENARNLKLRRVDLHDQVGPAVVANNSRDLLIGDLRAAKDGDDLITIDGRNSTVEEIAASLDAAPPPARVEVYTSRHKSRHPV